MLILFFSSIISLSGFFRQHKQQKQKYLVHVPGVSLSLTFPPDCSESVDVSFFRQQLEQQQLSRSRPQQGLQDLKQFKRLQQLGFSPSGDDCCLDDFFCVRTGKRLKID